MKVLPRVAFVMRDMSTSPVRDCGEYTLTIECHVNKRVAFVMRNKSTSPVRGRGE